VATLGRGALILAFLLAVYACVIGVVAARRRDRRLVASSRRAIYALLVAMLVADAVLMRAILSHNFSFVTVADTTARSLPFGYLVTSFWASQPGSLLLWVTVLAGFGSAALRANRRANGELVPWVAAIIGAVAAFFTMMLVVTASPFVTQPPPADGAGLAASLQNPYMIAHPPSLYMGYVGLTIPFAFCMAALLAGRTDARWIVSTRRWTLAAWAFLGIGMLLGAHWAYVEVGWGGFWGWDPVENAALMPWLVATAFLHSVMVQEKKGMLKVWNVCLVAATFSLSLYGTFLTRSGVLSSIHAFTVSNIGWYFVVFIGIVLISSALLIIWRLPMLRSEHRMESLVSREASFLFNNLLFVGLAFAVFWGVSFPIITKAFGGGNVTVNAPFFEFFTRIFGLPLIALMGIGPLIAWRKASLRSLRITFGAPFLVGVATGLVMVILGLATSAGGVVAVSLCAFVTATILVEFARGTRARRALGAGSWPEAFLSLIGRNRRRYGGYLVHLAMVLIILGIVGTTAYGSVTETTLRPGDSLSIGAYHLRFNRIVTEAGPNYTDNAAVFSITRNGQRLGEIAPASRIYPAATASGDQRSNEVAIRTDWTRGEDLFMILESAQTSGSVTVKALINPLVNLLWLGGILFAGGALVTAWPDRREARRLARRYAEEAVPGEV
jgi:cytochrome c-type biogenesis protein CcmF